MKKQNLSKRLQLKKTQISNLEKQQLQGGTWETFYGCGGADLSLIETCISDCGLTERCSHYQGCTGNGGNTGGGNGGGNNSGGISCPGYVC